VRHAKPFAIGLNCALGAKEMRPTSPSCARRRHAGQRYPNAGLPNEFGGYDETPASTWRG
jgi:5-methyltetrahydrofolate--homocysteine methyltransferase